MDYFYPQGTENIPIRPSLIKATWTKLFFFPSRTLLIISNHTNSEKRGVTEGNAEFE